MLAQKGHLLWLLIGNLRPVSLNFTEFSFLDKALKDGAEFFEKAHEQSPLFRAWSYFSYSHMKNIIIDDDVVITGSYNPLDERSTNDAEIAIFCQDKELNQKYSLSFARDLVNSIPYPYASQLVK